MGFPDLFKHKWEVVVVLDVIIINYWKTSTTGGMQVIDISC